MGCFDGNLGSTPWLGEQRLEAWIISHQLLWIKVRYTIMVRALKFSPSALFQGKIMWKVQTGERAPFWCPYLYFQDLVEMLYASHCCSPIQGVLPRSPSQHPIDWTVYHTPYVYMSIDGCIKSMNQFSNICCVYPVNNQILFFDVHDSHFNNRDLTKIQSKNI